MARKLNTRLLGKVLLFVGVPVAIILYLVFSGALSTGDPKAYYENAKAAYESADYDKAWIAIRSAMQAGAKKDPDAQFLLGQIAMKQKPPAVAQALQAYRIVAVLKPDHVEAQRNLAELYVAVRYWKEAKDAIARLKELDPGFGKAYLWGAVVEMGLAESQPIQTKRVPFYEAAAASCAAGIEKAPDLMELYRLLAQIYMRLDQKDKIDEVVSLAVANNPTVAEAYILKASRLISVDRLDEAEKALKAGAAKVGESAKIYVALGEVAIRRKDNDAAKEHFNKAVAADPKDEAGYLRLAAMYRAENDRDKALAILTQGLGVVPASKALLSQQADLYLETGENTKAAELIAQLEKEPSGLGVVEYLKGKQALMLRQVRQAITYLEQSRNQRANPQTRLLLGRAYLMAGELGAAQTELDTLVRDDPQLVSAWRTLADVQLRLRSFEKAGRSARVVLEAYPDDTAMRLLLAQTLAMLKRPADALKEAQRAAQQSKDDPSPYLLMAGLYREAKDNTKAEAMFRRAVEAGKDTAAVYQRFAEFYRDTNQKDKLTALIQESRKALPEDQFFAIMTDTPQELETELKKRIDSGSGSMNDRLALARLYQATDRADNARAELEKILAEAKTATSEWRQAWQQLFLAYLSTDTYDKAAVLIDQLKKVEPDAPELLFAGPLLLLGQDKLDEAVTALRAVTEQHKSLSQGHFLLGQVLARQRKWDAAIAELGRAIEARPNLLPARLLLGRIYHQQGNYAGMLTESNEALKYDPRLIAALEMKAVAHAGLGTWEAAVAAREDIAKIVPDNAQNLVALASLYVQRHSPEKAEEVFVRAYKLAPDNSLLVRAFADFYAETKRAPQGEKIVDEYLARHKEESSAQVVRGEFAAKVSGPEESEKYYRKAAELDPKDPFPLVFLGDQYSRVGQWEKASGIYREAVERAKDNNVPRKRLADVYMLIDKLAEAQAVIDAVLKSDPNDVAALVVAGRIASRQDKGADARKLIEKALQIRPDYGEAKVRLAELYAGPDPMRALDILSGVDPSDVSFEKAMLLRADINTRRVQLTEAILDLRRLLDFRPTSVAGRMQLAAKYMAIKEYGRSAELLEQLSKERLDQDSTLLIALGDSRMREEKPKEALVQYEKARAITPESPEALTGEVRALVALNRGKEAMDRVLHVMNQFPNEVWPRMALVALYEKTGELDKAFEALRTGLLRRQEWESGYVYLADLLVRAKRQDEARQVLLTGLQKVPTSIPIRAGLAALDIGSQGSETAVKILKPLAEEFEAKYSQQPDKIAALRPYMTSVRIYSLALYNLGRVEDSLKWGMMLWSLDPTDVANANNMAWILATEHKDFVRARDMIQRCTRLVPNHPQVLDTAGWIEFLDNRFDQATENLLASIKYGDNPEARYHLGCVYEARQRPEEAKAELQKAIEMGLNPKEKKDAEARLKRIGSASR